jgi:hypothetical protein
MITGMEARARKRAGNLFRKGGWKQSPLVISSGKNSNQSPPPVLTLLEIL